MFVNVEIKVSKGKKHDMKFKNVFRMTAEWRQSSKKLSRELVTVSNK